MATQNASVTLYVVANCSLCAHAREWLKEHAVPYIEKDVAKEFGALRAMYELTRQRFVPVVEVGGRALVRPSRRELTELLL